MDCYPSKFRFVVWGSTLLNIKKIGLHNPEVSRGFKSEMTTSEISESIEFKYLLCHLKIYLDPLMANWNSTNDFWNEVTLGLRLDDCNIQIKAPSTRIRFRLITQLFRCGYHLSDENGHRKSNFLKTLSRMKFFENAVFVFLCGRGKTELFENDDVSVYWIQSTRAKEYDGIWWFSLCFCFA